MDPEEMQQIIRKARGQKNRKPPQFMRITGPLKMMTMVQPNDGFRFELAIPFSQHFQTQLSWVLSNKKPAEFECMAMLAGGGNMMMEDEMSMIQAQTTSSGRSTVVIQKPIGNGVKLNIETDMGAADPSQCMTGFTLTKDFATSHIQY